MCILEKIFLLFLQNSITVSIVILVCLLLMKIFKNNIRTRVKHVLWALVIIKLLIPISIHINFSNINQNHISTEESSEADNINNDSTIVRRSNKQTAVLNYKNYYDIDNVDKNLLKKLFHIVSIVWFCGTITVIISILLCSLRFKLDLKKSNSYFDEKLNLLLNKLKDKLNIEINIPAYMCENIKVPCIIGTVKPRIYMPKFIYELDDMDKEYILLHELMHYKRKDLYLNLVTMAALSIHWFNPLVWLAVKKINSYREYACDAGVLEFLGEEKNIGYGMTLVNFSKLFINVKQHSKFAVCFETKNNIEERIKMIKRFKNGSYKMSSKAAIGCLLAATVILTNGISVRALNSSILSDTSNGVQETTQTTNPFLIDSETKSYTDISKIIKYAGFDFKLPDYIIDGNKPASYQLLKVSNTSNAVLIYFDGQDKYDNNFSVIMSKDNPSEVLKKVHEIKCSLRDEQNPEYAYDEQDTNLGDIKGKTITLTIKTPEQTVDNYTIPKSEETMKYFVWKDADVYYAVNYNDSIRENDYTGSFTKVSEDQIRKVAQSFKKIDNIKNVDYKKDLKEDQELSTELGIMSIYDRDDLKKAEDILGFNPKMPLKIGNDLIINDAGVGINDDSQVENNKINYIVNMFYSYSNNKSITFSQSKHDTFNKYTSAKENGYIDQRYEEWIVEKKPKVEKIDVNGTIVYKYKEVTKDLDSEEVDNDIIYLWEKDGIYSELVMFDVDSYQDEIVKEFVNAKSIE